MIMANIMLYNNNRTTTKRHALSMQTDKQAQLAWDECVSVCPHSVREPRLVVYWWTINVPRCNIYSCLVKPQPRIASLHLILHLITPQSHIHDIPNTLLTTISRSSHFLRQIWLFLKSRNLGKFHSKKVEQKTKFKFGSSTFFMYYWKKNFNADGAAIEQKIC